jgi:hypothetical protein
MRGHQMAEYNEDGNHDNDDIRGKVGMAEH